MSKISKKGVKPPFRYKSYEQVVDEANGITRKPLLGCLVVTIGSILYFSCTEKGLWHVGLDSSKDPLAVKGAFAWAA